MDGKAWCKMSANLQRGTMGEGTMVELGKDAQFHKGSKRCQCGVGGSWAGWAGYSCWSRLAEGRSNQLTDMKPLPVKGRETSIRALRGGYRKEVS